MRMERQIDMTELIGAFFFNFACVSKLGLTYSETEMLNTVSVSVTFLLPRLVLL